MDKENNSAVDKHNRCIKILREIGLTQREADAFLSHRWDMPEGLAEHWGISTDEFDAIFDSAQAKVAATGKSERELFGKNQINMFVD